MVGCKMGIEFFVGSVIIHTWLLVAIALGMPNGQNQFANPIPSPSSNQLLYKRPPVQFLDKTPSIPRNDVKSNHLQVAPANNAINVVKAIPYGSANPKFPIYPNEVNGLGDRQRFGGEVSAKSKGSSPNNDLPLSPHIRQPQPVQGRSSSSFNRQTPLYTKTVKNTNPVNSSPSGASQPNFFSSLSLGQNGNFGQPFKAPSDDILFNSFQTMYPSPEARGQELNGNYNPILSKGFSVPSTYSGQRSGKPAQSETLYAVANPMQDKREIIGSYIPRNDFVNPQQFVIPTEDKHNIVSRIFGGFQNPTLGNINAKSTNQNNGGRNAGVFNGRDSSQRPGNALLSRHGELSHTAPRSQSSVNQKNNNINLSNTALTQFPQGNFDPKSSTPAKSKPLLGTFHGLPQNKLHFDGGLSNPGAFPDVGNAIKAPSNQNNVFSKQKDAPVKLGNKVGQFNVPNTKPASNANDGLYGNKAQRFNTKPSTLDNRDFDFTSNKGGVVQTNQQSLAAQPSNKPFKFDSIDSSEGMDFFSNPKSDYGTAFDDSGNFFNNENGFMNQPPPVPLFSEFSQATPFTVNNFRSKDLLRDDGFGKTQYDQTRPSTSNFLGNENNAFQGQNFYGENDVKDAFGNGNNFGVNSGLGVGGFQQVGGRTVTTGNSYGNAHQQNQGYANNFDDSRPSTFAKQGRSSNTYQQNDGFDRNGSFNDGDDYANQYSFNDGDSVNEQRSDQNQNERNFRNRFEDQQQTGDKDSYSNSDGYNNAFVNGRKYDLSDGYTDNVNYNKQNSNSDQKNYNSHNGYKTGVAKVADGLANQRAPSRGDLYGNLPTSVSDGLPKESSYKPFDVNKPVFGGVVLS